MVDLPDEIEGVKFSVLFGVTDFATGGSSPN